MTGDKRRKRGLTADERTLWRTVTKSIKPLRAAPRVSADVSETEVVAREPVRVKAKATVPQARAAPSVKAPPKPPALTTLDRRTISKVARGAVDIDARIDLHGMTQARAHAALLRFVHGAQANDARLVLVITGKGARDGERGVLRRMVPHWLALPEIRSCVLGFETAHVAHGGEGALYVRIRRRK